MTSTVVSNVGSPTPLKVLSTPAPLPKELVGTTGNDTLTSAGSVSLIGDFGNDSIRGSKTADVIYGDKFRAPTVAEKAAAPVYGYQIQEDRQATITFDGESAGFQNTLGLYRIDQTGLITSAELIFPNASLKGSGGDLIGSKSTATISLKAGESIGFFVLPNGFAKSAATLTRTDGAFKVLDSTGKAGKMSSGSDLSLWFFPKNGSAPILLSGEYGSTKFFTRDALNTDNISHARVTTDLKTGLVKMGFEDLLNGGDNDFDDVRFTMDVGMKNAAGFPTTRINPVVDSNDKIWGGEGDDQIFAGAGNDEIWGENGNDYVEGGTGNDRIWGGNGNDNIAGGSGNDQAWGGVGNDLIKGGNGHDSLYGEAGDDRLEGGLGNDQIWDGDGNDYVSGSSGLDYVTVGAGNDTYIGGDGFDTIDFSASAKALTVDLHKRTATSALGTESVIGFERVIGTKFDDNIAGSRFADTLEGRDGNDIIRGAGGSDTLIGGKGGDVFVWASRSDLIDSNGARFVDVIKDFDITTDKIDMTALMASAIGARAPMFQLDETATGTMLKVNIGKDGWIDVVFLEGLKLGDQNGVKASWLLYGNDFIEPIPPGATSARATAGNDILIGGDGANTINGGSGNDIIHDRGGNDVITGGVGNDVLVSGLGDDKLDGSTGYDVLSLVEATGSVTVNLTTGLSSGALGNDTLKAFEEVLGSDFADVLTGSKLANVLNGGGGDDVLRGMAGNDVFSGGAGADRFVWGARSDLMNSTEKFVDTISDFNLAQDKLDLSALVATAKGSKAALFQLDETDLGTMLKVNQGVHGWLDVVMLEGVKLGDQVGVSADWLIV